MTKGQVVARAWVALVVALVFLHVVLPQRFGPLALSQILEPYLVVTGLIAGAVAFRLPSAPVRALVLGLLAIALLRYGPAWLSFPASPEGDRIQVSAWNIEAGNDAANRLLAGISSSDAQLIGLAELQPEAATVLAHSGVKTRFAFQALAPHTNVFGMGLLSQYPILEYDASTDPPHMRAVIAPPAGDPLVVYVVHPLPARFIHVRGVPVGIDTSVREFAISLIARRVEEDIAAGRSVIVLGDLNTTEREPAYAELSAGLRDAHLDAGVGPGFTWRPSPLAFLPFGLLRIDYVLSTPDLVPTSSNVECSLPSDHCRVDVDLVMTRTTRTP